MIRHIEYYREKIFAGSEPKQLLKWTVTSDQSTIFLDVVGKDEGTNSKLN